MSVTPGWLHDFLRGVKMGKEYAFVNGKIFVALEDIFYYDYPDGYQHVLFGNNAYWSNPPIEILDRNGMYYYQKDYDFWVKHDPRHPRCYYCGKFTKRGYRCGCDVSD